MEDITKFKNVVIWDVRFALVDDDGNYYQNEHGDTISFQHSGNDYMELADEVTPDDLTNGEVQQAVEYMNPHHVPS